MQAFHFRQNFNHFFEDLCLSRNAGSRYEEMKLAPSVGEGSLRRLSPRSDLEAAVSDFRLNQRRQIRIPQGAPMVELSYCFEGARETRIAGADYEIAADSCTLLLMDRADASLEFDGERTFHMLGIGIPIETFHLFMEDTRGRRTADFHRILGGESFRIFQQKTDPAARFLLQRIMRCAAEPGTKRLELECAILELFGQAFQQLLSGPPHAASLRLSRSDADKIRRAKEILAERMTDPPSLIALSRMIGLNDYKLKAGFKELFGTTVFGYLKEVRLETALRLLQQGGISVLEAACAVGYSNPSYFAASFRKQFGVNPGELVRGRV